MKNDKAINHYLYQWIESFDENGLIIVDDDPIIEDLQSAENIHFITLRNMLQAELIQTLRNVMAWCDDSPDFEDEPVLIKARQVLNEFKGWWE